MVPIIETTLARHADVAEHAKRGDMLERALNDSREISIAVGISMYSHGLSDKDAFARLRDKARSERRKLQELCSEIVAAANHLAKLN